MTFTVFNGETGGTIAVSYDTETIPAVSGYVTLVGRNRQQYRFDGNLDTTSGFLLVAKSGLGNLPAGDYIMHSQLLDVNNLIYFLIPEEVQIVYVPDFFLAPY